MSVSFAGRISYQSSYVAVPFAASYAVPAWISEVLFTPSTPIHVPEYAPVAEGCTVGTTHSPLTALNVGPVKMWPVQLVASAVSVGPEKLGGPDVPAQWTGAVC